MAGEGRASTLDHTFSVLRTRHKLTQRGQRRHANFIASFESPSFFATEPIHRPKLAARMRTRRADRSCGVRDTTFVQVSAHEEPLNGWEHTAWMSVGRHMPGRLRPTADMIGM